MAWTGLIAGGYAWLYVIAALVSGYLFYLLSRKEQQNGVEIVLRILAFGILVVGAVFVATELMSVLNGLAENVYIGYALQVTVAVSVLSIAAGTLRGEEHARQALLTMVFIILVILIATYFYALIYESYFPCRFEWLKQVGDHDLESCKTACYEGYGVLSYKVINSTCYCDMNNCR